MREIFCYLPGLSVSIIKQCVPWVIKGHCYVNPKIPEKCVTVRKWLAPQLSFVAMKRERFPPYSRHVRTIRFFISWQGRRKV